jgi:hypothetical protein
VGTITGVVSGFVTLIGGFSAKTPANNKEAQKAGVGGLLLRVLTTLLAPLFLAFVFILISLATNWIPDQPRGPIFERHGGWPTTLSIHANSTLAHPAPPGYAFSVGCPF